MLRVMIYMKYKLRANYRFSLKYYIKSTISTFPKLRDYKAISFQVTYLEKSKDETHS